MFTKSFDFSKPEIEKKYFSYLERCWDSTPASLKTEIKDVETSLKKNGIICSVFDFIKTS